MERQVLHGQVPAAVRQSPPLGRVADTTRLNLAFGLPLRNQPALTNLLRSLYDPASPQYRKFLTPAEFAERFGPSQADYEAVMAFAQASGFKVSTHPNRLLLSVEASAADLEKALHVTLRTYQHPSEKRTFYAPDAEPSLDLAVPVLGISGLNDFAPPRPRLQAVPLANAPQAWPNAGTGPSGGYMGKDFRNAYVPNSSLLGAGQTVGLLQFDGYSASDIAYYETKTGLPNVPLVNVLLDGFSGSPTGNGGEVEVSLDIEMAISMAPGLSKVIVYMAGPYGNWHDILNRMATDNLAKQLSCSWYSPGGGADPVADQIWQQMAAQGQSFFNASGDDDAYSGLIDFPGDTPYITQVGGTTLTMSANGGSYVSETVWNRGNGIGSGGGISTTYPIPSWQASLNLSAAHGSSTRRNTPDVALVAESVYVRANGVDYTVGGTSCSAPLWAGFAALANQQAATVGKPSLGFLNPALYAIGSGAAYSSAFHDTTVGNNTSSSSPSQFYAVTGYDLCTGWGTPAGQGLIDLLVPPMLVKLPVSVTEGDGVLAGAGQVQLPGAPTTNLTVTLVSSDPARVAVPASVVVAAGQTNAAFDLTLLDDGLLNGTQTATVTALAPGYGSSSASLLVYDKESALLQVLLPASVIKGQGQLSGTVQVSAPVAADVAVSLSSTRTNLLQVPASVLVPAGQTSAVFTATVLTDGKLGGPQAVAVTAHVQNWVDGTRLVTVFDNLDLAVRLPASAAENAGTLTNAGAVVLAGTTNADVVVALGSGNPAKLTVPATVTIPAGSLSNTFSLTLVDNTIADGHQLVSVTATVPGFNAGSASLLVLDDESPPIPANPRPGDLALEVPANTNLSWSSGNQTELVANGGFETGSLTNWVVVPSSYSKVVLNDGTYDPPSPDAALPPYAGRFSVLATETGPGIFSLYQDVAIPAGVPRATLSWAQRVRNFYSGFSSLQQFRVEVRDTTNTVLATPFTTQATDPLLGDWVLKSCDVTAYAGRTVRLAFVINPGGYYLDVHLDNISLQTPAQTGGPITNDVYLGTSPTLGPAQWLGSTTNSTWTLPLLAPATTYYWQVVAHRVGSTAGPVWQFTTRGVDHFVWAPVASPQWVGQPFPVLLTAKDAFNSTVSNFTGTVALSGWGTPGGAIAIAPTNAGNFANGIWSGNLTVLRSSTNMVLMADDGQGHTGTSAAFVAAYSNQPPIILAQPTDKTVLVGSTVTFSVLADGTPPFSYQWSLNGTNLGGATAASLTLSNVQFAQAGSYAVLVTNAFGATLSSNALLTVNLPPPCAPASTALVDWWRGEGDASDAAGAHNGSVSGGVTFPSGEVGQAFAFNGADAAVDLGSWFNLQVFSVAMWVNPSASQPGYANLIDNYGTDTRSWNVQYNNTGTQFHWGIAPGTSIVFTLIPNTWQCLVLTLDSNRVAQVFINGQRQGSATLSGPIPYDGSQFLRLARWGGGGRFFNGLLDEVDIYNRSLSTNEIAALYAAGSSGKCFNPFPPNILTQPTNQTVIAGTSVSFSVAASGTSPLSYQWLWNSTPLGGQTNPVLALSNVQLTNSGTYAVLVTNLAGSALSSNAILTVTPPPPCATPPSGLVSWWRAEGDTRDFAGANNGFASNGVSFATGEVGQAFSLNGQNQFIAVPDSALVRPGSLTVEGWFNFGPKSGLQSLVAKPYGNGILDSYTIWYNNDYGTLNGCISTASGFGPWLSYNWTPTAGVWHHIAYTFDQVAGTQALYLDGTAVASGAVSGSIAYDNQPLLIGADLESGAWSYFVGGLIDEVSLYGRALSASELQAIYNAGPSGKCALPVGPAILSPPTSQTALVGSNVTFSVTASGSAPLSYQWLLNSTPLGGQTNPVLALSNVQFTNAGTYAVLVTNVAGAVLSSNAVLTVNPVACTTPPSGLVSWWRGEGDTRDFVGANPGFASNGVTYASGRVGQAFSLNGQNQFIAVPDSALVRPGSLTVEGWFNFGPKSGLQSLVAKPYGSGIMDSFTIWYDNDYGTLNGCISTAGGFGPWLSYNWTPTAGVWHHIAYTFDQVAGTQALYLDGTAVASGAVSGPIAYDNQPLLIGADIESGAWSFFVGGLIDEVSLYERALSVSELQAIYNAGPSGKCALPVGPAILSPPTSQTALVGDNVTFSVTASGSAPLSYQWLLNSAPLGGQTNSVLALSNVQFTNAGTYAVLITNVAGAVLSSNAVLTVNPIACITSPSGLVSWWRGEGDASDATGAHNGVPSGGLTFSSGEVGRAFSFNGTDAAIDLGDWFNLQVFSVGMWVKPAASQGLWANIIDNNSGNTKSWNVQYDNTGLQFHWGLAVGTSIPFNLTANAWQYLVLTLDSNRVAKVYLNGQVQGSATLTGTIPYDGSQFLRLGRIGIGGRYFNGLMDEVDIYSRALVSSEVQALYVAGASGKCMTLFAPSILTQPTNQTVVVGMSAAFSVSASGTPPLSYQWRWNGTNLPGATTTALMLTNVQTANAGSYSVLVTNLAGAVLSSNAVLTVNPVPPCATPGLVDWWAGEGNANDLMGLHNGTLSGSVTFTNGEVGKAFAFNGSSAAIDLGSWFNLQVFSVAMWVKPAASQSAYANIIDNNSSDAKSWNVQYDNTGLRFHWGLAVGTSITFNLTANTWQYLTLTLDSNRVARVYLNGQVQGSATLTGAIPYDGSQFLRLARWGGGGRYFNGLLDEVDLYNRPLGTNEIVALYAAGAAGKCGLDHPPTAANIPAAVKANQPMSLSLAKVLLFCSDPDGDPLTVVGVSTPSTNGGSVLLGPSAITYTPRTNYVGADAFTYTISDGRGGTASASVLMTVRSSDQPSGNLLPPVPIPGGYQVSFLGLPGYTYSLQRAPTVSGPWVTLATVTADGSGMGSFADTNAPSGNAFYRTTYP